MEGERSQNRVFCAPLQGNRQAACAASESADRRAHDNDGKAELTVAAIVGDIQGGV
jgi:hypothetical protein